MSAPSDFERLTAEGREALLARLEESCNNAGAVHRRSTGYWNSDDEGLCTVCHKPWVECWRKFGEEPGPDADDVLALINYVRALEAENKYSQLIFTELEGELSHLKTWAGLMERVDEHYPPDIFVSDDPGPRFIRLMRELDAAKAENARLAGVESERDAAVEARNKLYTDNIRLLDNAAKRRGF
jgi:hypothetical protein